MSSTDKTTMGGALIDISIKNWWEEGILSKWSEQYFEQIEQARQKNIKIGWKYGGVKKIETNCKNEWRK